MSWTGEWIEAPDNGLDAEADGDIEQFEATAVSIREVSAVTQGAYGGAEMFPAAARILAEMNSADEITFRADGSFVPRKDPIFISAAAAEEDCRTIAEETGRMVIKSEAGREDQPAAVTGLIALSELGYGLAAAEKIVESLPKEKLDAMIRAYESGQAYYQPPDKRDDPGDVAGGSSEDFGGPAEPGVHAGRGSEASDQPERAAGDFRPDRLTKRQALAEIQRRGIKP